MYLLQKGYSLLLWPLQKAVDKLNETTKNIWITVSFIGLAGFFIVYFTPSIAHSLRWKLTLNTIICSSMLMIAMIFSIRGELRRVRWNILVFLLFFLSGAGNVAIGYLHPIGSGYQAWGYLMIFFFSTFPKH